MSVDSPGSVTILIQQMRRGDAAAENELLTLCLPLIQKWVQREFRKSTLEPTDCLEDVVQSVARGFVKYARTGQLASNFDRGGLWAFLVKCICNKVRQAERFQHAQKRDISRVVGQAKRDGHEGEPDILSQIAGGLSMEEFFRRTGEFMDDLGDDAAGRQLKDVAWLELCEYTEEGIAAQIEMSVSSVQRKKRLIRHIWSDEAPAPRQSMNSADLSSVEATVLPPNTPATDG